MRKNIVIIKESQLKRIISQSVRCALKENYNSSYEKNYICDEPEKVLNALGLMPYVKRKAMQFVPNRDLKSYIIGLGLEDVFAVQEYGEYNQSDSYFDEKSGWGYDAWEDYEPEKVEFDEQSVRRLLKELGAENKFQEVMEKLSDYFASYSDEWWREEQY